ncbi:RraA family protein [Ureibacillus sp. GCM10028918]|uniref:RraA family protein n=1 Tax=Ureibacillus sp. GCM10028918 TaxID=3273429 RepID=UPI00360EA697
MELDIKEYPELLADDVIVRASKLGSALLCDGMLDLGIPMEGAMEADILPVAPSMATVGTACTVDTSNGDNLPIHLALYTAKPGYVLVISGKGHKDHAYIGDLMISTGKAIGLNGIIVDGNIRDREASISLGFPVFAKGFMQRGPIKQNPGEINSPVHCGGLLVNPGDLVVGDADGVTVVPRDRIEEVLVKAEKKNEYEKVRREQISSFENARLNGETLPELAPDWVKKMLNQ